ncbi:MAG: DUF2846 domain-containing protein [Candidatus Acidiferrales bacterium]
MKQATKALFVILLFASSSWAQANIPLSQPEDACGPASVNFNVKFDYQGQHLPAYDSGKALVYFVQNQNANVINQITARVAVDGAWVGANQGNSYFFLTLEPGAHHLCARWQSKLARAQVIALNSLNTEAGKTYYFRIQITGGDREAFSFDLLKTNADEARLLIERSPYSISQPKK